jgi:hypothetical protein
MRITPQSNQCIRRSPIALAIIAALFNLTSAHAGTVVTMPTNRIADLSGQVIQADVTTVESAWAENPKRIESVVTLKNVSYLKGAHPDASDTFKLTVPGGTVGDMQMRICCAPEFRAGERWILFLLPTYKTFPVVGLNQGALRITSDKDGVERIYDFAHRPITGIDPDGFFAVARPAADRPLPVAAPHPTVRPRALDGGRAEPLSIDELTNLLRPILAASRDYKMTEPAGKRILVQYRPVPLRRAGDSSADEPEIDEASQPKKSTTSQSEPEASATGRPRANAESANNLSNSEAGTEQNPKEAAP